jgi:hypothetical protein
MQLVSQILDVKGNTIWSVSPDTIVFDALRVMAERNIGAVLVIENDELVGVMSERDYARKVILQGQASKDTPGTPDQGGTEDIPPVIGELRNTFSDAILAEQSTHDGIPSIWVSKERIVELLRYLKDEIPWPYRMLYDLTAIDERNRQNREGGEDSLFTVVDHLLSFGRNDDIRIKVPLYQDESV